MQKLAEVAAKPGFRKAAANLGWLFAERAGRFVLGALVGLLVARHLGPERLGSLSYCVALVTLLGFVPSLGLDAIVKRELLTSPGRTAEAAASAPSWTPAAHLARKCACNHNSGRNSAG